MGQSKKSITNQKNKRKTCLSNACLLICKIETVYRINRCGLCTLKKIQEVNVLKAPNSLSIACNK